MPTDELKEWMERLRKQVQDAKDDSRVVVDVSPSLILALIAEIDRLQAVVDAAVEWRRVGYERKDEFAYRIGPLLDAIDIYDVGHKRPCEEL
jgi:hypothetical protein